MAYRGKPSSLETVITDREFENLLRRSSSIFKERKFRLLKFPSKTAQNRLKEVGDR